MKIDFIVSTYAFALLTLRVMCLVCVLCFFIFGWPSFFAMYQKKSVSMLFLVDHSSWMGFLEGWWNSLKSDRIRLDWDWWVWLSWYKIIHNKRNFNNSQWNHNRRARPISLSMQNELRMEMESHCKWFQYHFENDAIHSMQVVTLMAFLWFICNDTEWINFQFSI